MEITNEGVERIAKGTEIEKKDFGTEKNIRVLLYILLVFGVATVALAVLFIYPFFNKAADETAIEAGRFKGEHRLEEYTIQCEYISLLSSGRMTETSGIWKK